MKIAITGATGFIASHLLPKLRDAGHDIRTLGRRPVEGLPFYQWEASAEPSAAALQNCDALIHLAGESVAQRWTAETKRRIRGSRIDGTRNLVSALSKTGNARTTLLAASAVGIYGSRGAEILTEESPRGAGFLADVSADWEAAARSAEPLGARVVNLRFGVILGADGGAFPKIAMPFRMGLGGPLGSGRQWMPWIHVEDAADLIVFALSHDALRGPLNVTSPNPVTNEQFTRALAAALHRPALLSVPGFVLKLVLGEMSEAALASARVVPTAVQAAGFRFCYPAIDAALTALARH